MASCLKKTVFHRHLEQFLVWTLMPLWSCFKIFLPRRPPVWLAGGMYGGQMGLWWEHYHSLLYSANQACARFLAVLCFHSLNLLLHLVWTEHIHFLSFGWGNRQTQGFYAKKNRYNSFAMNCTNQLCLPLTAHRHQPSGRGARQEAGAKSKFWCLRRTKGDLCGRAGSLTGSTTGHLLDHRSSFSRWRHKHLIK